MKVLRLSFHDCIRYEDGTGGCDGCLNWHGVGHRWGLGSETQEIKTHVLDSKWSPSNIHFLWMT